MVKDELFVQLLLTKIKFNPNWSFNSLNRMQLQCQLRNKSFKKTPINHELAVRMFMENLKTDISKFYKNNYTYELRETTFVLGQEFHSWNSTPLDILNTKQVGVNLYMVTHCIPSNIILLPLVQLSRRQNKRISPQMLVQHLVGEIDLLNQFLNF